MGFKNSVLWLFVASYLLEERSLDYGSLYVLVH